MKKLVLLLLLTACMGGTRVMTRHDYASVEVGSPIKKVETQFGPPYQVHSKGPSSEVYEYDERTSIGTRVVELRRYYLVVEDGKVVGKYMKVDFPPPYQQIYTDDPYPNY